MDVLTSVWTWCTSKLTFQGMTNILVSRVFSPGKFISPVGCHEPPLLLPLPVFQFLTLMLLSHTDLLTPDASRRFTACFVPKAAVVHHTSAPYLPCPRDSSLRRVLWPCWVACRGKEALWAEVLLQEKVSIEYCLLLTYGHDLDPNTWHPEKWHCPWTYKDFSNPLETIALQYEHVCKCSSTLEILGLLRRCFTQQLLLFSSWIHCYKVVETQRSILSCRNRGNLSSQWFQMYMLGRK